VQTKPTRADVETCHLSFWCRVKHPLQPLVRARSEDTVCEKQFKS
jgi:hypothetical protein